MSSSAKAAPPAKPKGPPAAVKVVVAAIVALILIGLSLLLLVGQISRVAVRPGFFGTRGSLFADLNLVLEIILLLGLTLGAGLAKLSKISAHQYNQTAWVFFNIVLVMFIMIVSFGRQVVPGLPTKLLRAYYATSVIHSLLGGLTIFLALLIIARMNKLLPKALRFSWWKNLMRVTLGMYWLVGLFGITTYYIWYVQPREVSGAPDTTVAEAGTVILPLANYSFNPGTLVIPAGTTVIFRNDDPDPHTVTSETGAFGEGVLEEKGQYEVKFDQEGDFLYFCQYHGAQGGIGMSGVVRVGGAASVAELPTAVSPPEPSPQPTSAAPAAAPFGATAVGYGAFIDSGARNNVFTLVLANLPATVAGEMHAWLTGDGTALDLGVVSPTPQGAAALAYLQPNADNLLATYTGFKITVEAAGSKPTAPLGTLLIDSAVPAGVVPPLRQLLVASDSAPEKQAYSVGLVRLTEELYRHAKAVNGSALLDDFDGMNRHIEHMLTIIEGQGGEHYKDFDGNGQLQDPGDGFGILRYAEQVTAQAQAVLDAPDGSQNTKVHAGHLLVMAANVDGWSRDIVARVIKAHQATTPDERQANAAQALQLAKQMLNGVDANTNAVVEPIPGEGGAYTIYFHSQYLAALGALPEPGSGIVASTPVPTTVPTIAATATPAGPTSTPPPGSTAVPTALPPAATPLPTVAAATSAPVFITYQNFEILPAQTTIKVGTKVTFLIKGSLHQPYNFAAPNTFEAPANLGDGASFSFTFSQAGNTTILCGYHGNMSAVVVVQP